MCAQKQSQWFWCALSICCAALVCPAQDFPEVMFVVDSSGSMQAALEGRTKLAIAKEVLRKVVLALPDEVRVGLAAYGHRQMRDCQDVEIIIPPGSDDRVQLIECVETLAPLGMTPITLALAKTAETIQRRPAETTIVLLTDGLETCGGDPLALVRQMKQTNLRFVLYVVGYDIKENEKQALLDLATAGGGQYFSAGDSAALLAALEAVRQDVAEKVAKAKTEKVQHKTGLGKLHLVMPEESVKSLAGLQIRKRGEKKPLKQDKISTAETMHPLLSGAYELWLDFANPNYKPPTSVRLADFEINGGVTTDLALGAIAFNIADGLADKNVAFIQITAHATGAEFLKIEEHGNDYYLFKPKPLPTGVYDVAFGYDRSPTTVMVASNVNVAAGKQSVVTLDSGFALKKPAASADVAGWDLLDTAGRKVLEVRRRSDNQWPLWSRFMVPPGKYNLQIHLKGMPEPLPAGTDIEVRAGQTVEFDAGL